jgi:hypothetical protein
LLEYGCRMDVKWSTHSLMWKPFMGDDDLLVTLQTRLNITGLPIPEHDVPRPITAADPLAVGRESHLTCVPSDLMIREPFLAVLAEIVGAVNENLVVQRLCRKVFVCKVKAELAKVMKVSARGLRT